MLVTGIDDLLEQGFVEEELRIGVEVAAWSLVHGLASAADRRTAGPAAGEAQQAVIDQAFRAFLQPLDCRGTSLPGKVRSERGPGCG